MVEIPMWHIQVACILIGSIHIDHALVQLNLSSIYYCYTLKPKGTLIHLVLVNSFHLTLQSNDLSLRKKHMKYLANLGVHWKRQFAGYLSNTLDDSIVSIELGFWFLMSFVFQLCLKERNIASMLQKTILINVSPLVTSFYFDP